jgi:hypothetical protein
VTDSPESAEIEEVRRLLAEARHTEPMPDDVVTRMDDVLTGLRQTAVPVDDPSPAASRYDNVLPLVHRRRRAVAMLGAAAAIVVGGVVAAQNLPRDTTSSSTSSAGDSQLSEDAGRQPGTEPRGQDTKNPKAGRFESRNLDGVTPTLSDGRLVVHPRFFSEDALAGLKVLRHREATSFARLRHACVGTSTGDGEQLAATYQRAPALLVYRTPSGGSQVVDLYVCGTAKPVRTATLPAP